VVMSFNMKRNWLTKEWLETEINNIGITIKDISNKAQCNEKTIRRNLKKYNLKSRNMSENASFRQAIHDDIEDRTKEIIFGELLGNGNLTSICDYSAYYQHSTNKKQYLEWLDVQLKLKSGIIHKIKKNIYHFYTYSYSQLKVIHLQWYNNKIKAIPQNLILTPLMALHWYLGDGGKISKNIITIGTYNFHKNDLERIMLQLHDFNPRLYYQCKNMPKGYGYRLAMNNNFLGWIGNCPEKIKDIYGYKW